MNYSQEEIQKYLKILESNIKNKPEPEIPSINNIIDSRGVLGGGGGKAPPYVVAILILLFGVVIVFVKLLYNFWSCFRLF